MEKAKAKVKVIAKYTNNILGFINALIVGLSPIWGFNSDKIVGSIAVITGVIGLYLLGQKAKKSLEQ